MLSRQVMELAPFGELFEVIRKDGKLDDAVSAHIAAQVASGLSNLHSFAVVHRNLKPEIVVLGADGLVKIASLGLGPPAPARSG